MLITVYTEEKRDKILSESRRILCKGGIIAYATESYYALGVAAMRPEAVQRLFALKKRPAGKPLPVIVGNMDILKSIVTEVPDHAGELIRTFWPGPLTIIFKAADNIPALLTGGTGKIAVRIPGESTALDIARSLNEPVTATSANLSSSPPARTVDEIVRYFGDKTDLIINAGETPGGKASTIVDVTEVPFKVLREGRIELP